MVRVEHFIQGTEMRDYRLQGIDFTLEVNDKVFPPSPHGSFFAENIKINKGESVIDVGTGCGILGILAAKLGGDVEITDNSADAIQLAQSNAQRNGVTVKSNLCDLFPDNSTKYDVILANLPQELVHEFYRKDIGEKLALTIHGGDLGNEAVLRILDIAKGYMHAQSRFYMIIYTVTDYVSSIKKMLELYNVRLVAFDTGPTKEFVEDNIDYYLDLNNRGLIKIFNEDNTWKAHEYLFELSLKN